jgi:23S rRNA (adenine1618-N6)-methyltransferase
MVVEGGELAFVRAMIADSRVLRNRIHWYSSMCGKKATLKLLRQELHSAGDNACCVAQCWNNGTMCIAVT